ncbi:hypothetical protein PX554_22630 [Sphingomonas sp. H39-1-10]|uniref:hypothetical protein n=1 Tax=Sphingomonas pollutisoli TaxID=3030829 RepID=UPI0023B99F87|nr:hypothetical protein [Sphingomonas pollutisoli]MDF0490929.1 hypothetical protein [Sphingomonas pollutisoli]
MNDHLDRALRINRVFQEAMTVEIPLSVVQTFLMVAQNEGKTPKELEALMHGNRSTTSRHLLDLSENLRSGKPGYGLLVRKRNPGDLRSAIFKVSARGRAVLEQLKAALDG